MREWTALEGTQASDASRPEASHESGTISKSGWASACRKSEKTQVWMTPMSIALPILTCSLRPFNVT